jgi:hypothetical protein
MIGKEPGLHLIRVCRGKGTVDVATHLRRLNPFPRVRSNLGIHSLTAPGATVLSYSRIPSRFSKKFSDLILPERLDHEDTPTSARSRIVMVLTTMCLEYLDSQSFRVPSIPLLVLGWVPIKVPYGCLLPSRSRLTAMGCGFLKAGRLRMSTV